MSSSIFSNPTTSQTATSLLIELLSEKVQPQSSLQGLPQSSIPIQYSPPPTQPIQPSQYNQPSFQPQIQYQSVPMAMDRSSQMYSSHLGSQQVTQHSKASSILLIILLIILITTVVMGILLLTKTIKIPGFNVPKTSTDTPSSTPTPTPEYSQSQWKPVGCFSVPGENTNESVTVLGTDQTMTVEKCQALGNSKDFKLIGIQNGRNCVGFSQMPTNTATNCVIGCAGNISQSCGGPQTYSVFSRS